MPPLQTPGVFLPETPTCCARVFSPPPPGKGPCGNTINFLRPLFPCNFSPRQRLVYPPRLFTLHYHRGTKKFKPFPQRPHQSPKFSPPNSHPTPQVRRAFPANLVHKLRSISTRYARPTCSKTGVQRNIPGFGGFSLFARDRADPLRRICEIPITFCR